MSKCQDEFRVMLELYYERSRESRIKSSESAKQYAKIQKNAYEMLRALEKLDEIKKGDDNGRAD